MSLATLPERADHTSENAVFAERLAASSEFFGVLPLLSIMGEGYTYTGEGQLPGVAFLEDPEPHGPGVGVVNPRVEWLHDMEGDLDQVEAMGVTVVDRLINGADTSADGPKVAGLKHRPVNEMHEDLRGERLSRSALDDMIDWVDGPTHIFVSATLREELFSSGWVRMNADSTLFYSPEVAYDGQVSLSLQVVALDTNAAGRPIMDDEGGLSSLLIAGLSDFGVCGLYNSDPVVTTDAAGRKRGEWSLAAAVLSGRALARISGIPQGSLASASNQS